MTATILPNALKVEHSVRPEINREFLCFSCPDGWDDVKKIKDKVMVFNGKHFTFTGWNSDRNECYFAKPLDREAQFATFKN